LSLEKADKEVLGTAAKIVVTKDSTTIVGDGTTQEEVNKRVMQIKSQIEVCILEDFNSVFLCSLSNHLHYLFCCGSALFFKLLLAALILPDRVAFICVAFLWQSLLWVILLKFIPKHSDSPRQSCIRLPCISVAVTFLGDIAQVCSKTFIFQATDQEYEREKLNERIAKLSGGVAVIQVTLMLNFR
jgi:hypothetical protein